MGQELTAIVAPSSATVKYEWQTATDQGGSYEAIPSATAQKYTVQENDLNKYIKVKAIGTGKFSGEVISSETMQVIGAVL